MSTNPCICTPAPAQTTNTCPQTCNCLSLCNITLNANDAQAVAPCGANGSLDVTLSTYGHDTCACGTDTQTWSLVDFDSEIFTTASITTGGSLSWTTEGVEAMDKQYGDITLHFACGVLSAYMTVVIGLKDLCQTVVCAAGSSCDQCTGNCIADGPDLEIT